MVRRWVMDDQWVCAECGRSVGAGRCLLRAADGGRLCVACMEPYDICQCRRLMGFERGGVCEVCAGEVGDG